MNCLAPYKASKNVTLIRNIHVVVNSTQTITTSKFFTTIPPRKSAASNAKIVKRKIYHRAKTSIVMFGTSFSTSFTTNTKTLTKTTTVTLPASKTRTLISTARFKTTKTNIIVILFYFIFKSIVKSITVINLIKNTITETVTETTFSPKVVATETVSFTQTTAQTIVKNETTVGTVTNRFMKTNIINDDERPKLKKRTVFEGKISISYLFQN
jgi:hypothetical protein